MVRKKSLIYLALFLFVFSVTAASAADVAYIYRKQYAIDQNVVDVIEDNGLTIDYINEADLPMNLNSYLFIYVGDENFRHENLIPVNSVPSIVANYYHLDYWGYADGEGASQLVASHPLRVNKNGQMIQVYTSATEGIGGPALPYYFIDDENIAPGLQTVALTETTSSGSDFGDVISIANPGAQLYGGRTQTSKMCFFGIVRSNYWTPAARQMFEDCVAHVAAQCTQDSDCGEPTYTGAPFCQNGDVYQTQEQPMCQNGVVNAQCVYPEDDVLIEECTFGCENGQCLNPVCEQDSDCDDNNMNTEDTCVNPGTNDAYCSNDPIECFVNSDCGTDGPVGSPMCSISGDSVVQDYVTYTCLNGGTAQSSCTSQTIENTVDECLATEVCSGSSCQPVACFVDDDCDDNDQYTFDKCNNAGTPQAFCTNEPIECFTDDDCDDSNPNTQDTCNNAGTVDSFCSYDGIVCFTDSDCGTDGPVGSPMCSDGDVVQDYVSYTCLNAGTNSAVCTSETSEQVTDDCSAEELCSAGQCIPQECQVDDDCDDSNPLTLDECINPGTVLNECRNSPINCASDADCGFTGFVGTEYCAADGNVAKNFRNAVCNNPGDSDSYCAINTVPVIVNECNGLCTAGECVPEECVVDDDCDDSNPLTLDECINPGTVLNECRNSPINCASDADCGFTGFVGSEICSVDDAVLKNEQTAYCMNPGEPNSYCEVSVTPTELSQCQFACYEGACIACDQNLDCDDGDDSTTDLCYNPGTLDAYCQNDDDPEPEIECYGESDCPADVELTGPYCSVSGDVHQIYMTFTCINPGETVSYCQSNIDVFLVEQCSEFCVNGMCTDIECFVDDDCDDDNSTTTDTCHMPGTPQSYCENTPIIECYVDADCDDNEQYTQDVCNNPGTVNSYCENIPIECFVDSDCGTDGPIGSPMCSVEGDVVQDYVSYTCLNAGTIQSSCTAQTTEQVVDDCTASEICSAGMCEEVECNEDADCPDGGFVGDTFCSQDDVYQEYLSGVCTDEGTATSMCSYESSDELKEECTYACAEGQCIRCDEDLDCDDGDSLTTDTCINPGTVNSMCDNEPMGECTPGETMACGSDVGQCQMGTKTCGQDGMYGDCVGEVGPSEEICDEIDNNCDGMIDEGGVCPMCEDECSFGSRQCIDGENYQICADFDGDGCTEWSDAAECGFGLVCQTGQCVPF